MRCSRDVPKPDSFSSAHLRECLKVRKISHFRSGNGAAQFDAGWLTEAFENNEKIRKLFIEAYNFRLSTFTNPSVLSIISKLRTIGLNFELIETPNDRETEILKIICALKKSGFPTITQKIDYSTLTDADLVEPVKNTGALEEALIFWLKTSDHTAHFLKLCFVLFNNPIPIVNSAIKRLKSSAEFADIVMERTCNYTQLRWKNGRIILSIRNGRADKPIATWWLALSFKLFCQLPLINCDIISK